MGSHLKKANLVPEDLRLLVVDKSLLVPVNTPIRVLITSADVIHRWSLPKARVKVDAVPGRVNQTIINFQDTGRFYGICREICGAGHSQIPIVVDRVTQKEWLSLM